MCSGVFETIRASENAIDLNGDWAWGKSISKPRVKTGKFLAGTDSFFPEQTLLSVESRGFGHEVTHSVANVA
jgi:hypothetical protein